MGRRFDTVTLLTDYGYTDEFAGVLHSVVRDLAPHVALVDLTHGIAPFDVRAGALALARAIPYVAEGVVLAVVDPGVGTSRRAVAIEVADGAGVLVGPDNGLLAPAVAVTGGASRAVALDNPDYHLATAGATFAGRDVFAPAAAHLCLGVDLDALGSAVDPALLVPGLVPLPRQEADGLHAEVLWVDRFGNCQLNVGPDELAGGLGAAITTEGAVVTIALGAERRATRVASTFGGLPAGSIGLVLDSHGMYALAMDQRSAAAELSLAQGDAVILTEATEPAGASGPGADPVSSPIELRRRR